MLSLPDFIEKQIIIVGMGEGKNMRFRNDNLVIENETGILWQVSCYKIFAIFVIGNLTITTVLIREAVKYGITIVLLTPNLNSYAIIGSSTEGNTLLRRNQYERKNTLKMAIQLVKNKIANQTRLLKGIRKKTENMRNAIKKLEAIGKKIDSVQDYKELLGYEGNASKYFFQQYFEVIGWNARRPRTKYDPANTLLDIGYTYLFNFTDALLRLYGFDTYLGFYHREFYQRKSLSCDIVEPFRCLIDQKLRKAYKLNQIHEEDFTTKKHRYDLKYSASSHYSKLFSEAIMDRKEDIFRYVQSFYYCMMKDEENLPIFLI